MSLREFASYCAILLLADNASGIWWGCSLALSAHFGDGSLDSRAAKEVLHSLEKKGYIKRFFKQGQRGNHPILIDKFIISFGALSGQRVNAAESLSSDAIAYEVVTENRPGNSTDRRPLSILETKNKKIERKNEAVQSSTLAEENQEIDHEAQTLANLLFDLMGQPQQLDQPAIFNEWNYQAREALCLLPDAKALNAALRWVFAVQEVGDRSAAKFWRECIEGADHPMAMVAKHADKIVATHAAAGRKKKQQDRAKPVPTQPKPDAYTESMLKGKRL
ncbi:MAG: hypothetical protein M3O09_03315 [Acidobacteriota bacterium]|nr:hypothetical protein [Acidobacteriota bacterium]